jgi:hypothetical protein
MKRDSYVMTEKGIGKYLGYFQGTHRYLLLSTMTVRVAKWCVPIYQ